MADLDVEILADCELWRGSEAQLTRALTAAAAAEGVEGVVSVLLGDDATIAAMNLEFRGKNGPTNVLSFPPAQHDPQGPGAFLGDIALAAETVVEEAQIQGKPFSAHASHLIVHGFLHLLGYDHETDAEAERMESRERAILASIGIDDPYV